MQCQFCKHYGHIKAYYWNKTKQKNIEKKSSKPMCNFLKMYHHIKVNC